MAATPSASASYLTTDKFASFKIASELSKAAVSLDRQNKLTDAAVYYRRAIWMLCTIFFIERNHAVPRILWFIETYTKRYYQIRCLLDLPDSMLSPPESNAKSNPLAGMSADIISTITNTFVDLHDIHHSFDDVVGQEKLKAKLKSAIAMDHHMLAAAQSLGIKPPIGVLLCGPPGTGKTMIAKAFAKHAKYNFMRLQNSDLFSKWIGQSEKLVATAFAIAKQRKPTVVLLDECDTIFPEKSSGEVVNRLTIEFQNQWNDIKPGDGVFFVCATNFPWDLKDAITRRIGEMAVVNVPTEKDRKVLFTRLLQKEKERGNNMFDEAAYQSDLDDLVKQTHNYSADNITKVVSSAQQLSMAAMMEAKFLTCHYNEIPYGFCRPTDEKDPTRFYNPLRSDEFGQLPAPTKYRPPDQLIPFPIGPSECIAEVREGGIMIQDVDGWNRDYEQFKNKNKRS